MSKQIKVKKCEIFFFFNDTATTEIYTLSLHDALPIYMEHELIHKEVSEAIIGAAMTVLNTLRPGRSEEHTSELQSRSDIVCRLLLEKQKKLRALDIPLRQSL